MVTVVDSPAAFRVSYVVPVTNAAMGKARSLTRKTMLIPKTMASLKQLARKKEIRSQKLKMIRTRKRLINPRIRKRQKMKKTKR